MKISVVTICFNAEEVIRPTLASVADQTWHDLEYVVVDGASTDGTMDVVREFEDAVDVLISEPDHGIYDAMNKGLCASTGDAVIFMNAGDHFYSDYVVELAAETLVRHPGADVVYGGIEVRHQTGAVSDFMPPAETEALEFLIHGSLPHQGTFARRRAFARTGLFDTRYRSHADYDWFLKVATDRSLQLRRMPFLVASYALGGASGQLERGERERHAIQNSTAALQSQDWLRRRIEIYQETYLGLRIEVENLRAMAATS